MNHLTHGDDGRLDMSRFEDENPDDRFNTELRQRLQRLAYADDNKVGNVSFGRRGSVPNINGDKRQQRLLFAAAIAFLLIGGLVFWRLLGDSPNRQTTTDQTTTTTTQVSTTSENTTPRRIELLDVETSTGRLDDIRVLASLEIPADWVGRSSTSLYLESGENVDSPDAVIQLFVEAMYLAGDELEEILIDYASIYSSCDPNDVELPPLTRPADLAPNADTVPVFDHRPWTTNAFSITRPPCEAWPGKTVQVIMASDKAIGQTFELVIYTMPEADEQEIRQIINSFRIETQDG